MKRLLVINGPNINMLGKREEQIYGTATLEKIEHDLAELAAKDGIEVKFFQSNSEGEIVTRIQRAADENVGCIIINPAAYTHTSIAIRDAISGVAVPVIEVHLSNIHARESFRHTSFIAPVAWGQIAGFGALSYRLAYQAARSLIKKEE